MSTRTCRKCAVTYTGKVAEAMFRIALTHTSVKRATCRRCEIEARTPRSNFDRALKKARDTFRRHANAYIQSREFDVYSRVEFAKRFGWDVEQMAHDILFFFGRNCHYCHHEFDKDIEGFGEITLDIVDPKKEPYYRTNVLWVCTTCNSTKRQTPPDLWEAFLIGNEQWEKAQKPVQLRLEVAV